MPTKKVKYYFNTNTLRYEKIEKSWKKIILQFFGLVSAGLVLGVVFLMLAYKFIDSPKEKLLRYEIEGLKQNYADVLNKAKENQEVLTELQKRDDNVYRVVFGAEPISKNIREAGVGGSDKYEYLDKFENGELMSQANVRLDQIGKRMSIQSKSYDDIAQMVKNKEVMLSSIPAIQPVSNKDLNRIASGFGYRIDPIYKTAKMHSGLDFAAPVGTPIYVTGDGVVELTEFSARGYGNHVVINHGYGYATLYGHMSRIACTQGQKVKRGDVIGYVGSTGKSTGPHLHYEVIKDATKIDPINFFHNDLTPDQYDKMLIMSSQQNQSFD